MSSYRALACATAIVVGFTLHVISLTTQPAYNGVYLLATVLAFGGLVGLALLHDRGQL